MALAADPEAWPTIDFSPAQMYASGRWVGMATRMSNDGYSSVTTESER